MYADEIRDYCIQKPSVSESFPFNDATLVFKLHTKIFALLFIGDVIRLNLKCESVRAIMLREQYPAITPGYHMNKTHWNTLNVQESLSDSVIMELIDHSYSLVFQSFSKKTQNELLPIT